MNKKTIIGIIFIIIVVAIIAGVYFFTGNNDANNTNQTISDPNVNFNNAEEDNNTVVNTGTNTETQTSETSDDGLKTLVVYFSVPETEDPNNMTQDEENSTVVVNGEVLGNTQYVAQLIGERTGGDVFRLEPVNEYPTNHDELLQVAMDEMRSDARPEIKNPIENFDEYDVIFIGYPIWNADLPPIINTFLEEYNFEGKTVVPFCTHGGSGLAGTPRTIANKLPNSNVITNGFSLSRNNMESAPSEVESWLQEIYN